MHRLEKNILHHAKKQRKQRKYLLNNEYKIIELNNGNYIQIKYDFEGVVYDKFNKNHEHIESLGFDLYNDIINIKHYLN
jgi:hypothetical protein